GTGSSWSAACRATTIRARFAAASRIRCIASWRRACRSRSAATTRRCRGPTRSRRRCAWPARSASTGCARSTRPPRPIRSSAPRRPSPTASTTSEPAMNWLWLIAKPVPVLCLVLWVLGAPRSAYRNRLAAGLALSLVGDVLIEWSFTAGLAAFLLAHVAYAAAFLADAKRPHLLRAVPIALYSAGVVAFLWRGLGE